VLPTETPELLSQLEACQKQVRALFGEVRAGGYLDANEYLAHRLAPDYIATLENFGQLVLGAVGNHMAIATTVPAPPAPHSFLTMTLPAWKLDLTDSGLPRGSPAFPYVADAAQRSLEVGGNQTDKYPVEVHFQVVPGAQIEDSTVTVCIGAATATSSLMIAVCAVENNWHQLPHFSNLAPYLARCCWLTCRYEACQDLASLWKKSLAGKMAAQARSRPNAVQQFKVIEKLVNAKPPSATKSKPRRKLFQEEIAAMRKTTKVAASRITPTEEKVILWLSTQNAAVLRKLQFIWGEERVAQSAITLEMLEQDYLNPFQEVAVTQEKNPRWNNMLQVTEQKILLYLDRLNGGFQNRIQQTVARGKAPDLRQFSAHYREES
jgi:hypothetical protein